MPKDLFLEFPSMPKDLIPALEQLSDFEIKVILEKIAEYVSSENFISRWDKRVVFAQCANTISKRFGELDE
jgi:hypothetical protein